MSDILNGYDMGVDELVHALKTDTKNGLSHEDAAQRLKKFGANKIPEVKGSFWQVYLAQLFNILITTYFDDRESTTLPNQPRIRLESSWVLYIYAQMFSQFGKVLDNVSKHLSVKVTIGIPT